MEAHERIRRDRRRDEATTRQFACCHAVHRRKVRDASEHASPTPRKAAERDGPATDPIGIWCAAGFKPRSWTWSGPSSVKRPADLAASDRGPRRAGHRAVHPTVVTEILAELPQIAGDVTVVQGHALGTEARTDFGASIGYIAGGRIKLLMFVMHPLASGRPFIFALTHQAQQAFFEGTCSRWPPSWGVNRSDWL